MYARLEFETDKSKQELLLSKQHTINTINETDDKKALASGVEKIICVTLCSPVINDTNYVINA
jgi:hypothetical protein